jgi:predicted nucleic acid-binding protein
MIYFDVSYIVRLYFEDQGWERVRALAAQSPLACSLHGYAETVAAMHRKLREGVLTSSEFRHVLHQFTVDCDANAYRWLPVSLAVVAKAKASYENLPKTVFLRSSDALHLASASENAFREIYSNDAHLLAAAGHFSLRGVDIT